jgi:hypothetical protein
MVRIDLMEDSIFPFDRRDVIAGLGAVVLSSAMPSIATAQRQSPSLTLRAGADVIALRPARPDTPIWSRQTAISA